jgi:hypothetical protein
MLRSVLLGCALLLVMGVLGAVFGLRPLFSGGYQPSRLARGEIPPAYLRLYMQVGRRYGIDPWILAGIGAIETNHGQSTLPGVHSGVNAYGCCAGPMQFSLVGSPRVARERPAKHGGMSTVASSRGQREHFLYVLKGGGFAAAGARLRAAPCGDRPRRALSARRPPLWRQDSQPDTLGRRPVLA